MCGTGDPHTTSGGCESDEQTQSTPAALEQPGCGARAGLGGPSSRSAGERVDRGDLEIRHPWLGETFFQDGSGEGVIGQRFDSSGARVGGEFLVNTFTTSAQVAPRVDMSDTGDCTAAWPSFLQDGSYLGAFAQRFDSSGGRRGCALRCRVP